MTRLLTSVIALSLLASAGAAAAQPHHDDRHDNNDRYEQGRHDNGNHYGQQKHRWARGQRLDRTYYSDRSHYIDYRAHHLRAPPRGYQWVRADNDYALVALTTGLIASIVAANH